jgi:trehalose 6-phosphate phosphatase
MMPLFSRDSLVVLESMAFTKTLFAFDFDGTLSRIVSVPSEARMKKKTSDLLCRLSKLAAVAIVSGRSVSDLRQRLDFEPRYIIGNHGLEGMSTNARALEGAAAVCRSWLAELGKRDWEAGTEIEDKTFSLAIHYRRARSRTHARQAIRDAVASLHPRPRVIEGKLVCNLVPPGAPHKGAAIEAQARLLSG